MKPLPIFLDTDIGDDIDDALALAVILNSPELELRGISTVFRDAKLRAQLTEYLLGLWNRSDIPVYAGCSKPLLQPFNSQLGKQFQLLKEVSPAPVEYSASREHAVDFLIRAAQETEEKITILPIGPLTNIALAIAREPELIKRSEIVMMGGMWDENDPAFRAEWNIECDPEAAAIVFESGIKITMIGLDVTLKCRLEKTHVAQIAEQSSERARVLSRLLSFWLDENSIRPILHDPLAVLTLFDDCVKFEEKKIEVLLCGQERGKMKVLDGAPNAFVATEVDAQRAVSLFMERILL